MYCVVRVPALTQDRQYHALSNKPIFDLLSIKKKKLQALSCKNDGTIFDKSYAIIGVSLHGAEEALHFIRLQLRAL